jgi:hypothetical protein
MPHPLAYAEHLRTWTNAVDFVGWTVRLDLWDTGRMRDGKSELRYALAFVPEPASDLSRRVVIFDGEQYWPSPLHAIDSDMAAGGLLSFFAHDGESLSYRPDEDEENIAAKYSAAQRELLAAQYEALSMWSMDLEADHDADDHDWESCGVCVERAKDEEILGPDAKPFR